MKPRHLFAILAVGFALPGLLPAQTLTSGVPGFISYQGRVLDSTGAPVGTGTPVNRKVIFRVWDHPSNVLAANLIYSEEQTVTIADGKFSVLVGQGIGTTAGQFSFSETPYGPDGAPPMRIADAFNGSDRYLGVTVDDGTAAVDNEIAPRQQIVSSAFAFRSKYAETLGSGAAGSHSLTQLSGGSLAVSGPNTTSSTNNPQFLVTADDVTERLRIGVDSTGNGASFLQSWKEGTGGGTGFATNLLLNPNGGNVAIGTATPIYPAKLFIHNNANTAPPDTAIFHAPNIGPAASHIHNGTNGDIYWRSAKSVGKVILQDTGGNVGIGTTTPLGRLHVVDTHVDIYTSTGTSGGWSKDGLTVSSNPGVGFSSMVINSNHSPMADRGILDVKRQSVSQFFVRGDGNVGIGTSAPGYKLEVTGSLYSHSLNTGPINAGISNFGAAQFRGVGRSIPSGGLYLEWGNQSPGSYGQSFILNNQEGGNAGIYLGEVNNAHAISWSLFTQPGGTHMNGTVYGWSFVATSDERIKSVGARSSSEADLDIVRKLRVTDYKFIDQKRGAGRQKGFIAQEVQKIVPEAVMSTGKSFIPSVYAEATKLAFDADSKTLSITMAKAHDLKVGDLVEMTEGETRHEWKVSGVKDDKTFAVGSVKELPAKLFVYGKQVPDILAVDYDRLFVSGIGAIQELVKQVDAVKLENAELKAKLAASEKRLSELSATDQAFEAKLAALEKRLQGSDKPAVRAVSLQGE